MPSRASPPRLVARRWRVRLRCMLRSLVVTLVAVGGAATCGSIRPSGKDRLPGGSGPRANAARRREGRSYSLATLGTVRSADSARQAWNEGNTVTHEDAPDWERAGEHTGPRRQRWRSNSLRSRGTNCVFITGRVPDAIEQWTSTLRTNAKQLVVPQRIVEVGQ